MGAVEDRAARRAAMARVLQESGADLSRKRRAEAHSIAPYGVQDAVASTFTLGLSDLAGALGRAVGRWAFHGEDFDFARAREEGRRGRDAFFSSSPVQGTAASLAGGAGAPLQIGSKIVQGARTALPNAPKTATALGMATAGGAEAGFMAATQGDDIASSAAQGAALGTAIPGAMYLVGLGARYTLGPLGRALRARLLSGGPMSAAERKLLQIMERDGLTPARVEARLQTLGPEATIADAGGGNIKGVTRALASEPGQTANLARGTYGRRALGQSARLVQSAERNLGVSGVGYHERMRDLRLERSNTAAPLYREAFEEGDDVIMRTPVHSERLQEFLGHPLIQRGIREGLEIQRIEALARAAPFRPEDYMVRWPDGGAGEIEILGTPNMRLLDAAKVGLDTILEAFRDPKTGKVIHTRRTRAIEELRASLVRELDELTGGPQGAYARARSAWQGPSHAMDMMWRGRQFMREDPDALAMRVDDMSPVEKEFFREGVFQELQIRMGGTSQTRDQTLRWLRTPNVVESLKATFPDERSFRLFMRDALRESEFAQTRNRVTTGSDTASNQRFQEDVNIDPVAAADVGRAVAGDPAAAVHVAYRAARMLMNSVGRMPPAQKDKLGEMLVSQDPQLKREALRRLKRRYNAGAMSTVVWDQLRQLAGMTAAVEAGRPPARPVTPVER